MLIPHGNFAFFTSTIVSFATNWHTYTYSGEKFHVDAKTIAPIMLCKTLCNDALYKYVMLCCCRWYKLFFGIDNFAFL